MITKIEAALVERLKKGLGRLAVDVAGYSGQLDDRNLDIRRLPAVLVSYGGSRLERVSQGRSYRHTSNDIFVVVVLVRSLRSGNVGRIGGVGEREIGANQLVTAVKRLLINQTLGGLTRPLKPLRVQTLLNNQEVKSEKLTAYALEFEAVYDEADSLEDGRFPEQTSDKDSPDYLFNQYRGELSDPLPDLHGFDGVIFDPVQGAEQKFSIDTTQEQK